MREALAAVGLSPSSCCCKAKRNRPDRYERAGVAIREEFWRILAVDATHAAKRPPLSV